MTRRLYPLGIQTFERIVKENKLYVDKTEYIYRMSHSDSSYFFLGRPRRFGKSLLVSTMQKLFCRVPYGNGFLRGGLLSKQGINCAENEENLQGGIFQQD